ncbi:hypothetical protein FQN54_001350 [Arachnomyces sp. PD_36]|nr:hypothetical protein FQN54_001350 [Arachnomyces sp. PD_36]
MVDQEEPNTASAPVTRSAARRKGSSVPISVRDNDARITKTRRPQKSKRNLPAAAAAATASASTSEQAAATLSTSKRRNDGTNTNKPTSSSRLRTGTRTIQVGDKIPLETELVLTNGEKTTLKKHLDTGDRGGLVVFVYPNASSEETYEYVCEFDYRLFNYERAEMSMLGLSPDSFSANAKFKTDTEMHFTLLSDPRRTLLNAVGLGTITKTDKKFKIVGVFVMNKSGTLLYVKSGKPEKVMDDLDREMILKIIPSYEGKAEEDDEKD